MSKRKTFISMTTIPGRLASKRFTNHIKFLLKLIDDECLIINIPIVSRNQKIYKIPPELLELANTSSKFIINNECRDEGPITKMLPSIRNDLIKDEDILIIIDDDRIYKPKTFKILSKMADKYPNGINTFCQPIIQGHLGFSFIKKTLKPILKIKIPNLCIKIDDYILNQFAKKYDIPINKTYYTRSDKLKCADKITNNCFCSVDRNKSRKLAKDYEAPQLFLNTNRVKQNINCGKVLSFI